MRVDNCVALLAERIWLASPPSHDRPDRTSRVDGSGASVDRQFCLPASRRQKKTDLALRVRRPCGARAVRDEALRRVASGLLHRFRAARSALYGRNRQHLLSGLWASAAASRRL